MTSKEIWSLNPKAVLGECRTVVGVIITTIKPFWTAAGYIEILLRKSSGIRATND